LNLSLGCHLLLLLNVLTILLAWRVSLLLALIHFFVIHFRYYTHLILSSYFEVGVLALLDLTIDALNFKSVLLGLRLEVLYLNNHLFQLFTSLFKRLLVQNQLLSNLWATLLCQNILQFDVQLFFLLNQYIFLTHFFCFSNETLLKGLNLLN